MAPLRWITGLLPLLLAGSLVSCTRITDATTPDGDSASQFVADLIANVSQAEQEQQAQKKRLLSCAQDDSLVVNLGYAKYRGYHNASTGLNYWKGIRYAASPTGELRWQPPQVLPLRLDAPITDATEFGPICPQSMPAVPNAPFLPGNEDCLFLNVFAPPNASKLPVLVYIHEGGYGLGDGTHDMTEIINANEKGFVAVTLQYRLGAFGWLSSREVKKKGAVNAGMLDQVLALAWVKLNICQFGGDPSQVTISGESAGGGSVMYHSIALKGNLGNLLYKQGIAASPYLLAQPRYDAALPTSRYYAFSQAAGCPSTGDVFDCIVSKDTDTLQQASFAVTQQSPYGYWGFWPVTDDAYVLNRPTQQFAANKTNGQALLVGHNANEGPLFVPPLTTEADLINWLQTSQFPNLTPAEINTILAANPNTAPTNPSGPHHETDGLPGSGLTAVEVSAAANGQQQRGNNIYAEATFACPAYWLASAYAAAADDKGSPAAWVYQYSVPMAWHGADVAAYFGPATPNQSDEFALAFRRIWGNFVRTGNPSISAALANGAGNDDNGSSVLPHPAADWPAWTEAAPVFVNLNTTGGVPFEMAAPWGGTVTGFAEPGLGNAITLASATEWEGGRKGRCDVYKGLADSVPF